MQTPIHIWKLYLEREDPACKESASTYIGHLKVCLLQASKIASNLIKWVIEGWLLASKWVKLLNHTVSSRNRDYNSNEIILGHIRIACRSAVQV